MLKEKIQKYFNLHPSLHVLFFFDESAEFREDIENLQLEGIRTVLWNNNNFYLKVKLHGEWKKEKVLLYLPFSAPKNQQSYHSFPLLDLLTANKELILDDEAGFMEEYHLQRHQRSVVKRYMRELKHGAVQEVCKPVLNPADFEEKALVRGLLSSFLRYKKIELWPQIVAKMLTLALPGQEEELKRFSRKVRENNLLEFIEPVIKEYLDYKIAQLDAEELKYLLKKIRYNQLTEPITKPAGGDPYAELKITKRDIVVRMNQLVQEALKTEKVGERFSEALNYASQDIHSVKLIEAYGTDAAFGFLTPEMVWEQLSYQQGKIDFNPKAVIEKLEGLSVEADNSPVIKDSLNYFIQTAKMIEMMNTIPSLILDRPEDYLLKYTEEWYKIDLAYRKAVRFCRSVDSSEVPAKIKLDELTELLHKRYESFTEKLNREWLKCLNQFNFNYNNLKAPKQYEFYQREVFPYEQKVVVIISDALRYESAQELLSELHGDPKNTADIRYQLASIPSITRLGMAQLLTGKQYQFNEGKISIDGISTEGVENRQRILAATQQEAIAVQYDDLEGKKREEIREIFKSPVVYVYHDVIDATGDKRASERKTFEAVTSAIEELKKFVKNLHASYNVARVLITADHGFLYNEREIEEKDKENPTGLPTIISHNRYEVVSGHGKPSVGYKIPLGATTKFKEDLFVVIPESVNRYKKQGAGHKYVHGGGSLQELVVPVIESSRKRQEVAKRVKPMLIQSGSLRIVSNILRLNILQQNKVSRLEKEAQVTVGLYKDFELVSNQVTLQLNSTSEQPSDRLHRAELILLSSAAGESFLKLKIVDVEDKLNPLIEERVENNTLIQLDF
jgi:hypothetical protein